MSAPLRVGDPLYGFCGGFFGRSVNYGVKRVEAIGTDWVVARDEDGKPWYADVQPERLAQYREPDEEP